MSKKPKFKVVVDRQFLLDLANDIYDPKTRQFLRLCDGTLQNGPDPTDEQRPMHCGLGELYFAMTDLQPKDTNVSENDVIDLAVELSTLPDTEAVERARKKEALAQAKQAAAVIKALSLPEGLKENLLETAKDYDPADESQNEEDEDSAETKFRQALDEIPGTNDDGKGDSCTVVDGKKGGCTYKTFQARSARVARQLREAAKHLPA